ncbi:FG-GAP repeat protein [Oscillatoria sp. FACHB-1407]|uniref:FG-GAP-like repeat-containing protein n=1 Tax=Oscillatoria sp. FACHB-1407 TaxID=2692847 RepID=UPI0016875C37|nr:FG-GAP-like repeat-containing protein [Oscillatoria sp. FACHB-1407]MBD2460249.1 FG-GAP repeat protein [Oscillatoria sp. FACHB-1407]
MSIVLTQQNLGPGDSFGWSLMAGNFNGSGADDLVVGVPFEDVFSYPTGEISDAGVVAIYQGSNSGLGNSASQSFHQNYGLVPDVAEGSDRFGYSLAVGDFDGDGYDDLVSGIPFETFSGIFSGGAVQAFYGSASGLTDSSSGFFYQGSPGILGTAESFDYFGHALVAADFNGDGRDDLVIGAPGEDVQINASQSAASAGAVNILYGSNTGLSTVGDQFFHKDSFGIEDSVEASDQFGTALTAGDYNGDGYADLAVGSIGDNGTVNVIYGTVGGLNSANDQLWTQDTTGIQDTGEAGDQFGSSLASGDFDGNGRDDLAVGVPGEDLDGLNNAGAVSVIYGTVNGLQEQSDDFFHQGVNGIQGSLEAGDRFGTTVTVGDFNNDGYDDLAVGSEEGIGGVDGAGAVNVFYGSSNGLTTTGSQFIHQDLASIAGSAGDSFHFSSSLTTGDFNNDGYADLGIGSAWASVSGVNSAGAVHVVFGSANGLVV